jgi:hypothetical protein
MTGDQQIRISPLQSFELFLSRVPDCNDQSVKLMGLTTKEEQLWCEYHSAYNFLNKGAIVELGPWLGSLTLSIQKGLLQNKIYLKDPRPIHSYDCFIWENWCEGQVKGTIYEGQHTVGSSFEKSFLSRVKNAKIPVKSYAVDLNGSYPVPSEIELVINDGIKSWNMAMTFAAKIMGCIIPSGYLAHQDFLWPTESFLIPLMYNFREHFSGLYCVPNSCMVIFQRNNNGQPIKSKLDNLPKKIVHFSPDFIIESFNWVRSSIDGIDTEILNLCHATILWVCGHYNESKSIINKYDLNNCPGSSLFIFQRETLKTWRHKAMFE